MSIESVKVPYLILGLAFIVVAVLLKFHPYQNIRKQWKNLLMTVHLEKICVAISSAGFRYGCDFFICWS